MPHTARHHLLPGTADAVGAYALVDMGAVFAGAARAPITAVVILFELTGEYSIILPLMLGIVQLPPAPPRTARRGPLTALPDRGGRPELAPDGNTTAKPGDELVPLPIRPKSGTYDSASRIRPHVTKFEQRSVAVAHQGVPSPATRLHTIL